MRFIFPPRHTRATESLLLACLLIAVQIFGAAPHRAIAETTEEYQFSCKDLLVVFARGSGQNKLSESPKNVFSEAFKAAEPESFSFFSQFKTHIDVEYPHVTYKAVSIHDFPGKYDPVGYRAVGVGLLTDTANLANSEVSMIPGDYRESVEHGTAETLGYLRDQINSCPDQSIVVGGYSQGAQVMGDALAQLSPLERSKILGVGFVGDPKFVAGKHSEFNPFSSHESYPWRRGDALETDSGMLDPRSPYVPQDIEKRTASYCYRSDLICSGFTGMRKHLTAAHEGYGGEPMRHNVNEIMQWAGPALANAERARGGFGSSTTGPDSTNFDNKPKDVMFLLNDDAMAHSLYSFRYDTDIVLSGVSGTYPNVNYAAKGFGETDDGQIFIPRVDNIQSFLPYVGYDVKNPMFTTSNLLSAIATRYPFARQAMGSGDWADPHGIAVEKAAFAGGWRPEAEKHIVLVSDSPPKLNYSFNLCNGTVRSWMHVPETNGYLACTINGGAFDIWPKVQHSEFCATIYLAITSDQCKNPMTKSDSFQMTTRTLNDAIIAAQSQHIAVDVVIPNKITNQYHPELVPKMAADMEYLAKATGGIFINYNQRDQFDNAAYSDMMYQVLGHKPKDIVIAYKEALESTGGFNSGHVLGARTNQPVILDVSQSNSRFSNYNWDFNNDGRWDETSSGPVVEHVFDTPQASFVRVAGLAEDGTIDAETHLAVNIIQSDAPSDQPLPSTPDVTATASSDGSVRLEWQSDGEGVLIVSDTSSGIPLVSTPLAGGLLIIPNGKELTSLSIRVSADSGTSEPSLVLVTSPPPVGSSEPDPTICYKLQQCTSESVYAGQYNLDTPFVNQPTVAAPQQISEISQDNRTNNQPLITTDEPKPQVKGSSISPKISETVATTITQTKRNSYWAWIFLVLLTVAGAIGLYRPWRKSKQL